MPQAFGCFLALLSAASLLPAFSQDSGRRVRAIGEFSNMRHTEEHSYGYAVELWRDGDSVIGLFLAAEGLQGDTPTGMFTAKLTTGRAVLPGGGQEPSRDLFEFFGFLKASVLTGTLQRSDPRQTPAHPGSRERVRLKIQPSSTMPTAGSYAERKRQTDEILTRRGPKW